MTFAATIIPIAAPLLAALAGLVGGWRRLTAWLNVAAAASVLACGLYLGGSVGSQRTVVAGRLLGADALSAVMLIVIGTVGVLATWASVGYIAAELDRSDTTAHAARQYTVLVPVFMSAMAVAVEAQSVGVIWAAVEATTVTTAFLVGHRRTRESLEATWKYVVICSFGITLAFLGTVVLYFASIHTGARPADALNLDVLARHASAMNPAVTRLGVGLLLIGFGTKAGLVPFHTWLADAHSQAPAPVSALMSGVLLSVALSVLLRVQSISDRAVGAAYMRHGLLIMGLATIVVAVSLLVAQKDFKRLLAYSSLEQMGFMAVAASSGSRVALAGVLLLVLAHGLVKAVLFVAAGDIQHAHHSSDIAAVRGLLSRSRLVGPAFAAGIIALLGFPPFALFPAELAMARGMAHAHQATALILALGLLVVGFVSIARHTSGMLLGTGPAPETTDNRTAAVQVRSLTTKGPLVVGVAALALVGVAAGPLPHLLASAANTLGTAR